MIGSVDFLREVSHSLHEYCQSVQVNEDFIQGVSDKDFQMADRMLKKGADVNVKDKKGNTLLIQSVQKSDTQSIRFLLSRRADLEIKNHQGKTALLECASAEMVNHAKTVISKTYFETEKEEVRADELYFGLWKRNMDNMTMLIEAGANVNALSSKHENALHLAVKNDNSGMFRLLLEHGTNPTVKNIFGETPVDMAIRLEKYDIIKECKDRHLISEHKTDMLDKIIRKKQDMRDY